MSPYNIARKKALMAAGLVLFGLFFGLSQPGMAWTGDGYAGPITVCTIPEGTIYRISNNAGRRIGAVFALCKSILPACWIATVEWFVLRLPQEALGSAPGIVGNTGIRS